MGLHPFPERTILNPGTTLAKNDWGAVLDSNFVCPGVLLGLGAQSGGFLLSGLKAALPFPDTARTQSLNLEGLPEAMARSATIASSCARP